MRIALVSNTFFPHVGGAEYVVHNLATTWHHQGHEVCVFNAVSGSTAPSEGGYRVRRYRIPLRYFKLAPHRFPFGGYCARNIKRELSAFRPDFISAHTGYPLGVWLSKITPLPRFIITCHGRELTKFPWGVRAIYGIDQVLANALNSSGGVVAISTFARKLMLELGIDSGKIVAIPNGVDIERFRRKVKPDIRGRLGIPPDSKVVLSVGRDHPQKAYDDGIRAFSRIAKQSPGWHYVIVGSGTGKWQSLVAELGLNGRVILCEGFQGDDLVGVYQQADIFFSPSVWELMPLVVLEAMASGLPLLVTNVSGSQDLVKTGVNGFIVEPGELGEMAKALQLLIENREMRESIRDINIELSAKYSWDNIARMYLEHA